MSVLGRPNLARTSHALRRTRWPTGAVISAWRRTARGPIFLATSTARALEESGNYELASEAYRSFAQVIAKSEDEKLSEVAKRWEGIARQLDSSAE